MEFPAEASLHSMLQLWLAVFFFWSEAVVDPPSLPPSLPTLPTLPPSLPTLPPSIPLFKAEAKGQLQRFHLLISSSQKTVKETFYIESSDTPDDLVFHKSHHTTPVTITVH